MDERVGAAQRSVVLARGNLETLCESLQRKMVPIVRDFCLLEDCPMTHVRGPYVPYVGSLQTGIVGINVTFLL